MAIEALKDKLESGGFPVTYRAWPIGKAPPLPWVAYYFSRNNNFAADGAVYYQTPRYIVELYCRRKSQETEERFESSALSGLVWSKSEVDLPDEKMVMIVYEIEP